VVFLAVITGIGLHHAAARKQLATATVQPAITVTTHEWSPRAAAHFLDVRESWWNTWHVAARDQGTFCVSCHTSLVYMLAKPALRQQLGEIEESAIERQTIENVRKRVILWSSLEPYYEDQGNGPYQGDGSRATESVINAVLLSAEDARPGKLSPETVTALDNMWALQILSGENKGAWPWQKFGLEPWESKNSVYFGAAIAALAVGLAPENYSQRPEIQPRLLLLRSYLHDHLSEQSVLNQMSVLWASAELSGLLTPEEQAGISNEILAKQRSDGGWKLSSLLWNGSLSSLVRTWKKNDWHLQESQSDALATGLSCFVLQRTGLSPQNLPVAKGLSWLREHQNISDGSWAGYSLNRKREPSSDVGLFMTDAATSFAALALTYQGNKDIHLQSTPESAFGRGPSPPQT
jgi:squalene-hopene/tetraprenyl-beta-curcumene cyclase